ncbi:MULTISPECIES: type II secretion system F family protein [Flavobacteriaceae]|uniref:type II secretion system F family protein n=1 Tax=Flavobacteriaceae TaxID=49546 RepID=UPI0039ED588C
MKIDVKEYRHEDGVFKKRKLGKLQFNLAQVLQLKLSDKIKSKFYRELKVLLRSGITIEEAIFILISQTKKKSLKDVIDEVYQQLQKGKTLVDSVSKTNAFTSFEINTLAIGEETKKLPKVLEELEVFYDRKHKLKSQIVTVLTYPTFVIIITIAVLIFMLRSVVPMFEKVFKQFNSELPSLTKKIIYLSNNFSSVLGFFLGGMFLIVIGYIKYGKRDNVRNLISLTLLKIPFFGGMIRAVYLSRFCRGMNLLLSSKVSLVESLNFVKTMVGFYPIESSIDSIKHDIIKGQSLSESLKKHSIYDVNLVSMVRVAEEVNELDKMFSYLTEQYTEEVDTKSKRMGVLIEPFIIIVIGSLVGVIMVAMYLPMFDLSKILNSN